MSANEGRPNYPLGRCWFDASCGHRGKLIMKKYSAKKIDWDAQPLGEVSDRSLAKRLGVSKTSVRRARRLRRIAPAMRREANHPALRACVLTAIMTLGPARSSDVTSAVREDFGSVSHRQVQRTLRELVRGRKIRVTAEATSQQCYSVSSTKRPCR
mgnify:CR=1 FL=1